MEFGDHCRIYDKGWRQQAGAGFIPCQNWEKNWSKTPSKGICFADKI
jgi:hypothetical protein